MNVFDFALKMEEDGKTFYEKLAAQCNVPELRTIFTMLAAAEEEHHRTIEAMKKKIPSDIAESKVLEHAKNVFQGLLAKKSSFNMLEGDADGYRHATKLAEKGIKLYEEMAEKEPNPAAAKVLRMLADAEKEHLQIMANIYDFVESPKDFLAWGEFGNLKEY